MVTAAIEPTAMPARRPPKSVESPAEPQNDGKRETVLKLMRKPFEPHQISTMCKSTKKDNPAGRCNACGGWHKLPAVQLSYVGHAALTDRLLDADPEWTWEPLAYAPNGTPLLDADGGMWIKLTVGGITRLGYGDAQGKSGGDATKERIGDALRNAAMRFGAALELWHKGSLHITDEPEKDSPVEESKSVAPPPAPVDKPTTPIGSILPFQKNALLSACKKSGKSNQELMDYLGTWGIESLDEMPKKNFPEALKWAME